MSTDRESPPADSFLEPGVRWYLFLACTGLIVTWLLLTGKFGILALVPVLAGAAGVAAYLIPPNWGALSRTFRKPLYWMPVLYLVSILFFEVMFGYESLRGGNGAFDLNDMILCPAVIAYLAGQYRLFSLGTAAVPPDARPRPDRLTGDRPDPRPAHLVEPRELGWLGGIILGCLFAGQLMWLFVVTDWVVTDENEPLRLKLPAEWWRLMLLVWMLGVGTVVLVGGFRILRSYRLSADESRMVLQEELWAETRGEQRRQARWLAWARQRANKALEKQT